VQNLVLLANIVVKMCSKILCKFLLKQPRPKKEKSGNCERALTTFFGAKPSVVALAKILNHILKFVISLIITFLDFIRVANINFWQNLLST